MPETVASEFGGPSDIAAYKNAKANGATEDEALAVGDNGVGAGELGGIDTTKAIGMAVPRDALVAKLGNNPAAFRRARIKATIGDQTYMLPAVDEGPGSGPRAKGVEADLTHNLARGVGSNGMAKVSYEIIPDAGPDPVDDPKDWQAEQDALRSSLPGKGAVAPEGSMFKRRNPAPEGAIHKREATPEELASASEVAHAPAAEQPAEEEPESKTPAPVNAQPAAPVNHDEINQAEDSDEVFNKHSARLDPSDQRVTRRINPDTGSNKLVGQYFVPGDPVHDTYFLSGLSPADQAKLPWISNAIGQGGPFSYLYDSAQQYSPGQSRVTGQSRAMEQKASTAEQRISGEHEAQMQRTTMLPMQMMATEPKQDSEGNIIPSNILLEGFLNDAVMNNARHLMDYAGRGSRDKVPVPYTGLNDFNLHRDVSGYLENQRNGFMGDGQMMVDENGQPHPLWKANQAKPTPYVPHLLDRPKAEFVHAMMNIRAPKNPKPPTKPPGFGERAAWQRRVNEGYSGSKAGVNTLLQKLDQRFPELPVHRERIAKDPVTKKAIIDPVTGEKKKERYVHHHAPFSEAEILEPTWRAYRLELMHHEMPPIGTESLRGPLPSHVIHTAPHFKQTLASHESHHGPGAAPISENPEIGAPLGEGPNPERIKAAAVRHIPTGRIVEGHNHYEAAINARRSQDPNNWDVGFTTDQGRFLDRQEAHRLARAAKQIGRTPDNKLDTWDLPYGTMQPSPLSGNPEVGAPIGAGSGPDPDWFQGSKVTDEGGNPLVVHHGTARSFENFDPTKAASQTMWFTSHRPAAQIYAQRRAGEHNQMLDEGELEPGTERATPQVRSYHLALKNPFDASQPVTKQFFDRYMREANKDRKERGIEPFTKDYMKMRWRGVQTAITGNEGKEYGDSIMNARGAISGGNPLHFKKMLQRMGHDGIKFHGPDPIRDPYSGDAYREHYDQWGAFSPEQIHKADYHPGEDPAIGSFTELEPSVPEGQPGALSQEAAAQEQTAPPLPPPASQGIDFASPNIRDDMSFNTAKKALKGKEHAVVRDYSDRLEGDLAKQYGYQPAQNIDTIGDYQQTAENTIMTPHEGHLQAHRRVALALKGLHGGQKQVLSFRHDNNGEHYLYNLKFNHDKPEAVRALLDKQGIQYRTMEPAQKGQPVGVHLVDFDGSVEKKLEKLFKQGHIGDAYQYRGNAELIGDENSRERAAQAFRRVLQEARDQAGAESAGRGGLHGGEAWFEPYAREAEENFQRLRKLEEFEKQEIANDHKEAGVDRDIVPPDQEREKKRLNRIGKKLVASDPSMAELDPRSNHAYILKQKQFPRTDMKNADVGEYFDANHPRLDLINNPEDRETAAHIYYQDLIHSLAGTANKGKPSSAFGWYDRTVRKTINKMAQVAPEILSDPDHELAFKLALAVTSQGQEVNPNAESSWHVYQYWKKHGKFPTDVRFFGDGQKFVQMEQNFKKLNDLWNGTEEKPGMSTAELRKLLTDKTTVGKLKEEHGLKVAGENIDHVVRGAMGLGPKVGAFFSNLMGHFDPVTMDMWWSRDFNKIAGNMFNFSEGTMKKGGDDYGPQIEELAKMLGMESGSKHPKLEGVKEMPALTPPGEGEGHVPRHEGFLAATPEEMEKMREEIKALRAIPADQMDRPAALAAAPTVYQWAKKATRNYARSYGEEEGDRKRSFHPDFKTRENSLGKRMYENVNKLKDDPRGAAERKAWREITGIVEKKLRAQGIRLTNADKQALGWFNIKDVFALAGANAVRNADYLDAAYTLTRRIQNGDLPDLTNG